MQPYFFPYAGYFRLFAVADIFVVLDCVQFPRRGWVHRNQLPDNEGNLQWLTLPLIKGPRNETRICDLKFQQALKESFQDEWRRYPTLVAIDKTFPALGREIRNFDQSPVEYLMNTLQIVTNLLGMTRPIIRSSELQIPEELRAQCRIIEIARRIGAKHYINAPGGRNLYEAQGFEEAGITLNFLPNYSGPFSSILQRLAEEKPGDIAAEVLRNLPIL